MIEQSSRDPLPPRQLDLDSLRQRATQQHARHRQVRTAFSTGWLQTQTLLSSPVATLRSLPPRFLLHSVVALLIPAAVAVSQVQPGVLLTERSRPMVTASGTDFVAPPASFNLAPQAQVGDGPILDENLPIPLTSLARSEALAPIVVQSSIAAERAMLRNGPGTNYDALGRLSNGAAIQVVGRHGDWFQVREKVGAPIYWVAGELLAISEAARNTLFDIPDSAVPPPPPPKIGAIKDDGVQLRDGPGTNYVPMNSLIKGQIDLIERYQDWLYVSVAGQEGWVRADMVEADAAMISRLLVTDVIPDPNPAMVASLAENEVNLRKGPDSRYAAVGTINAGEQVELLGKYKSWVKIQTGAGTVAWVFGDLLNVTGHVMRRVVTTSDFPALPQPKTAAKTSGGGWRPANSADLASIAASGDVANFALQFVGMPYIWGAESPSYGFDCSGLTRYVYRAVAGVNMPHNAAAQFYGGYGAVIGDMNSLQPGDMVFYVNTSGPGITHVAIYIGGGQIVHALSPRYGVGVSSMWDSYYTSRFYGAIRVRR